MTTHQPASRLTWPLTMGIAVALLGCSIGCSSSGTNAASPEPQDASAGSDAPAVDGNAPGDGGGGPDAPSASCAGLAYCDGFESYGGPVTNGAALGPWMASVSGMGVAMAVDGQRAYGGSKALHITVPAGAAARGTLGQKAAAGLVAGNDLYGRAMVYYSDQGGNGLPLNVHSWLFNAAGTSSAADGGVTMNMGGGGAKLQLNYHPPPPATEKSVQGGMITAGAWHCVQWQYDGSGSPPADQAKVWIDGAVAVTVPKTQGWDLATPWTSFDFGFTHYQTLAAGVDVYLDELAVDGKMVPCP